MTYRSNFPHQGVQWICIVCDGAEESAPGEEPPSPPVCPTCARLTLAGLLAGLEVWA